MTTTVRLTMAQALVAHLAALRIEHDDGSLEPYCAGVWAIFGHGNVAGLGEALQTMMQHRIRHLPIVRGERLCGILSERDILHYRAVTAFREDWWRAPVTAAMEASVQTAGPDSSG